MLIMLSADFSAETTGQKGVAQYTYIAEREECTTRNSVLSKALVHI